MSIYSETIKQLKTAILTSRYKAASLANRELVTLYFNVGRLIDLKSKQGKWGDKILQRLSNDLQQELPGLKGFSATNLKNMRAFYNYWSVVFEISQSPTETFEKKKKNNSTLSKLAISQSLTDQFTLTSSDQIQEVFFNVSFTHHTALISQVNTLEENLFYLKFSFRDIKKPMGVATYKTSHELPAQYKNVLPNAATLKKLMG